MKISQSVCWLTNHHHPLFTMSSLNNAVYGSCNVVPLFKNIKNIQRIPKPGDNPGMCIERLVIQSENQSIVCACERVREANRAMKQINLRYKQLNFSAAYRSRNLLCKRKCVYSTTPLTSFLTSPTTTTTTTTTKQITNQIE